MFAGVKLTSAIKTFMLKSLSAFNIKVDVNIMMGRFIEFIFGCIAIDISIFFINVVCRFYKHIKLTFVEFKLMSLNFKMYLPLLLTHHFKSILPIATHENSIYYFQMSFIEKTFFMID